MVLLLMLKMPYMFWLVLKLTWICKFILNSTNVQNANANFIKIVYFKKMMLVKIGIVINVQFATIAKFILIFHNNHLSLNIYM